METDGYWKRLARQRLSRRRMLAGAVTVGAGLVAVPLVGCGGGGGGEETEPTPEGTPSRVQHLAPAVSRGGTVREFGYEAFPLDTLDPHQTQFGPLTTMISAIFSRVLLYQDVYEGIIEPDMAQTMPEQPDELTYVIKLWPNITFHDTPQIRTNLKDIAPELPGRQLTVEDIKYSFERQINENSPKSALYYRKSHWQTVDKFEIVDPLTLKITTKRPTGPFLHFLADSYAFIIGKELVDPKTDEMNGVERMVGTGPFIMDKFVALQLSKGKRNPNWFGKDLKADLGLSDRPILDGYEIAFTPGDITAREAAFRSKQVDSMGADNPKTVERIAGELGLDWDQTLGSGLVSSRFLVDDSPAAKTPFKDIRLRKAIHLAVDRNEMVQQALLGGGYPCGPVAQANKKWAFTPAELATKPGYRFGTAEREEDISEAKKLWEAAGGSAVGTVHVLYAGIPDYVPGFFPQLQAKLKEVLGLQIEGELDPTGYTTIAEGLLNKSIVMTFNFDNGWNDLHDYVYPYFHTGGPKNSFMLVDPELDRMLDAEQDEMDFEKRRQLGFEIQDYLLDKVVAMPIWMSTVNSNVDWSYYWNAWRTPWFDAGFHRADFWFDMNDPTWQGRPA
jgi:peptide/nickel transport system substrate-binding protein